MALYTAIEGTTNLTFAATLIPALIAKSSIIWNPIIYVVRHRDFRKACIKTIKLGLFCKSKQTTESTIKTDYIHRHQYQANIETRQKLIKQSSLSYSECSSSHDSCAGTGITGLMFESYDIACREKVPKLTSKEDWKDSPHPIVRRSFEQKKHSIPSINPEYIQYLRKKDTVTKTCLRKSFLKNTNVSNILSTVVDIECETGQSNTYLGEDESVPESQHSQKTIKSALYQSSLPSVKANSQSKSYVRRQMSVGVPHRESYIPIRDPKWFGAEYSVRAKSRSTMFETRCDKATIPYRKKYRSNNGGRRHLSDSSTTVNKQSRYSKYDAKQKRSMMRSANLHQKIEMSVFEKETSVFNSDEAQDELQGLTNGPNDDGDPEAFEAHIGACSMIRQSTV